MIRYHCSPLLQTMTPMDRIVFCSMGSFRHCSPFNAKAEAMVSWGSTFARLKLKEIDGMAPPGVECAV